MNAYLPFRKLHACFVTWFIARSLAFFFALGFCDCHAFFFYLDIARFGGCVSCVQNSSHRLIFRRLHIWPCEIWCSLARHTPQIDRRKKNLPREKSDTVQNVNKNPSWQPPSNLNRAEKGGNYLYI